MHFPLPLLTIKSSLRPTHLAFRPLYSSIRTMTTKHDVQYSSNSDQEKVAAEVSHLCDAGRWNISATKAGVEREFKFKTFKTTWAFMNKVAEEAGRKRHHPEWSNVYNTTFIRWTTHHPPGLSQADVELASFCDKAAEEMGELVPEGTVAKHQSIQEKLLASEAAESSAASAATTAAAASDEGKTPGEMIKEQIRQSEAEARGEDAGGIETLIGGSPGKGELESGMCGLTERAVKAGGDCCVPKSARKNVTPEDKESNVEKVEGEELHNMGP